MRAISVFKFGDPSVLKLVSNLPIPTLASNQVLIRVHSAGVNPVDAFIRSGKFAQVPDLPYTPGYDCAGKILALSPDLIQAGVPLHVGQRVYTTLTETGSYADHAVSPSNHVHPLPDHLSFAQGAALGVPYYTAFRALITKGKLKKDDVVLIHGASGAVGLACCQIAAHYGATVLGTAGTSEGEKLVQQNGAHQTFNHLDAKHVEQILTYTKNRGVDLIVEMLADKNLNDDCLMAASDGRIMVVGSIGELDFAPRLIMHKELSIQGVALYNSSAEDWRTAEAVIHRLLVEDGRQPTIAHEYTMSQVSQAHEDVIGKAGKIGKLVINTDRE